MKFSRKARALSLLAACLLSGSTLPAQTITADVADAGKTLVPGVCQSVSEGDLVTLEWNPAFSNAAYVAGLREVRLRFASDADRALQPRLPGSLELVAFPRRDGIGQPFKALQNGFYQITFRVHTRSVPPGEYRLTSADALPQMQEGHDGEHSAMTNNPARSSFCLEVVRASRERP